MSFKRFLVWSSSGPPVWWSGTIYASLRGGIMGNIQVIYFGSLVQEKMSFKEKWTDRWTDGKHRPITIAHPEPRAL